VLCGFYLVALPPGIRWLIDSVVSGCELTAYLPFVLIAAVLMKPWQAGAVALASVGFLGNLFMGSASKNLASECFLSGTGIFLASSAAMIGIVVLVRRVFAAMQSRGADEAPGGVVFSLERGQVWASWYGQGPPELLGSQRKVSVMMEDFLRQEEFGKRLNGRP
jgi:hypothetical protein